MKWGDGTTSVFNAADMVRGLPVQHRYTDNGTFNAQVKVVDVVNGATATATPKFSVANVAPSLLVTAPTSAVEGGTVTIDGTVSDPSTTDTHTVTIDWGHPSIPPTTVSLPGALGRRFVVSKAYGDSGAFTIKVTVRDDDGGSVVVNRGISVGNASADAHDDDGTVDGD